MWLAVHPRSSGPSVEHGWTRVVVRTTGLTVHPRSDRPSVERDQSPGLRLPGTKKNLCVREGSGEKQSALVHLLVCVIVGVLVGVVIGALVGVPVAALVDVLLAIIVGLLVGVIVGVIVYALAGGSSAGRGSSLDLLFLEMKLSTKNASGDRRNVPC